MKVMNSDKLSPYGEITWMEPKDVERLIYVYKAVYEEDNFIQPSVWLTLNAFDDRIYYKARDRGTAQRLCDELHGKGKYTVVSHKILAIR